MHPNSALARAERQTLLARSLASGGMAPLSRPLRMPWKDGPWGLFKKFMLSKGLQTALQLTTGTEPCVTCRLHAQYGHTHGLNSAGGHT